jgi:hypothetical protein
MASTYSPNLRLELIGTGDQQGTWGATTNTNLGTLLEEAIGGYTSVTVSDVADTTLTTNNGSADQSRNAVINLTGTISAARNVVCPAIEKVYIVRNATTGGYAVTFKVSGQTGVSIPNGSTYLLYINGTDAVAVTGTMAAQLASNVAITGGTISGVTLSNATVSNVSLVANASSLGVRDSDGSHVLSIAVGSNLTSNTTLTLTTGTSSRTLDISASNVTVSTAGAALIDDADASAQRTTLGLGTIATQNSNNVSITGGSITGITDLAVADGGTGASDASTARTNLGIGTIGTQNSNNVAITGGSITGITDLAVADGGTGSSTASGAATNLGLGTGDSPQFAAVNIGSATDTTITRVSAGVIAVEGKTVVTETGAQTVQFAAGTNTAPSITTTGDTNTGIFFPAADTIAFAEGGVEVMRIDSSSNVGIGITPSYKLDISGTMRTVGFVETVFAITDGASVDINPANGTIQTWTLGASRTPTASSFLAGQSVTLMILDGTAYSITWSTIGVTWVGGSAPALDTTLYTVIHLWKVGSTVYGALIGYA